MPEATPNAAMAENWNGPGGRHWVDHAERHDRALGPYGDDVLAAASVADADRILDVGCGTGAMTRAAARRAPGGTTLGVDIGQPMVDAARTATVQEGGPGNVTFEQADAQVQTFGASAFDLVISRFGVMFFDDPAAAFANLRRALADGGRIAFASWQGIPANEWIVVPVGALLSVIDSPDLPSPDEPGPFSLSDPEHVGALLAGAGFAGVATTAVSHPMWLGTDVDDAVSYMIGQSMARRMLEGRSEVERAAALDALRSAVAPYVSDEGVVLDANAWIVTADAA